MVRAAHKLTDLKIIIKHYDILIIGHFFFISLQIKKKDHLHCT